MPDSEVPLPPPAPSQGQEVSVDANIVIQVLRQQISELQWQNTILQSRLITAEGRMGNPNDRDVSGNSR